jgi:hypothetical protein
MLWPAATSSLGRRTRRLTMNRFVVTLVALAGMIPVVSPSIARADDKSDQAALAAALKNTKVTLEDGLKASEREGTPISAKFEVEDGKFQLSVYTTQGGGFKEVVVDPKTGAIAEAEKITDPGDLDAAKKQKAAVDKATVSLLAATEKAVKAHPGDRAVSIFPETTAGRPTAEVTLMQGQTFKKVPEKLG